ncbi:MAG: M24B family metallopeptidase, partial [Pseudomonadota bacterium]|nr:M24B family metallopeptidase [Pseudomonadota bacterium]
SQVGSLGRSGIHAPDQFISLSQVIHEMRLFKSSYEVEIMKKAAAISSEAHIRAMKKARPGINEFQIEAELTSSFISQGARYPAYPSIVGGGKNACILHYTENNSVIEDGDLVLVDAGAEYEFYAADITRTFPINGVFSDEQRAIYEVVLEAQAAAIEQVRPGNIWDDPHKAAVRVITEGLVDLQILTGEVNNLVESEAYRPYFMHKTGHWLGLDVHDVGEYKIDDQWRSFEPGMVTTVEPGLYLSRGIPGLDPKWFDIGVRIEDDVLVTNIGNEVITSGVPKVISEIEGLMS